MKLKMLNPRALLTLQDGTEVEVERIGRGRYSTAWRNCQNVYLQTNEKDYGKELISRVAEEKNPHIPACVQLDWQDGNAPYRWYRMPLYQPLTAKSVRAWEDFKALKQAREDAQRSLPYDQKRTDDADVHEVNAKFVELVEDATYLSETLKEAVRLLVEECQNYGAYTIEISKRNCAVDAEGNLILLDPVFDLAEVRSQWRKQRAARY